MKKVIVYSLLLITIFMVTGCRVIVKQGSDSASKNVEMPIKTPSDN